MSLVKVCSFTLPTIPLREGREGIDLTDDEVQKELHREKDLIRQIQLEFDRLKSQTEEQLRLNRKDIYNLKINALDKLEAQRIDEHIRTLKHTDDSLPEFDSQAGIQSRTTNVDEWEKEAARLIDNCGKGLQNSRKLRSSLARSIQNALSDLMRQVEATNRALEKRCAETRSAKQKFEELLAKTLKKISSNKDTIHSLEGAIRDKSSALRLASTRLNLRSNRPSDESCLDAPDIRLVQEVDELTTDINELQNKLDRANESLLALNREQLRLEDEIQRKTDTLFIDEVQCRGIRSSISIMSF